MSLRIPAYIYIEKTKRALIYTYREKKSSYRKFQSNIFHSLIINHTYKATNKQQTKPKQKRKMCASKNFKTTQNGVKTLKLFYYF